MRPRFCFLYSKWIFAMLPLVFCYSLADHENTTISPIEIMCIVDKYISGSLKTEKLSSDVKKNLWNLLLGECSSRNSKDSIVNNTRVMSIDAFLLERKIGSRTSFRLYICELKTSADAVNLFSLLREWGDGVCLMKPPIRFFIYERFIVFLIVFSFDREYIISEAVNEILEICCCNKLDYDSLYDRDDCSKFYLDWDSTARVNCLFHSKKCKQ